MEMERLDRVLQARYPDFSRSRLEGLVKAGFVTVNGAAATKAGMKVSESDEIEVEIPPPVPAVPEPEDIPLDVVYEDDDLIVVDKPAGLVVHPAPGHFTGTLVNALLHHCPNLAGIGGVARPGIVHRLDQYTSGLIAVAKSQPAMDGLVRAFSTHRDLEKTYLALVHGRPSPPSGRIENLIGRHPVDRKRMAIVERNGKLAITNYRIVESSNCRSENLSNCRIVESSNGRAVDSKIRQFENSTISLVECRIETGRTHQIRVHMASLGCPIAGDAVYGKHALDKALDPIPARQMLHAWRLSLRHPVTRKPMTFEAPIPADFRVQLGTEAQQNGEDGEG